MRESIKALQSLALLLGAALTTWGNEHFELEDATTGKADNKKQPTPEQMAISFDEKPSKTRVTFKGHKPIDKLCEYYKPYCARKPKHGELMQAIRDTCKNYGIEIKCNKTHYGINYYIENKDVPELHEKLPGWIVGNSPMPKGKHGHDYRIDSMRYNQVINN